MRTHSVGLPIHRNGVYLRVIVGLNLQANIRLFMWVSTLCLVAVGTRPHERVFLKNAGPSCGVVATKMVALALIRRLILSQ